MRNANLTTASPFRPLLAAAVLLAFAAPAPRALAQKKADDETKSHYAYLVQGMKTERLKLRTGVFRAFGFEREPVGKAAALGADRETIALKVELFCAFDFEQGKIRFDRKRQKYTKDGTGGMEEFKYIQTKTNKILLSASGGSVAVFPIDSPTIMSQAYPFDVRTIGQAYYTNMLRFTPYSEMQAIIEEDVPTKIARTDDGLTHITVEQESAASYQLWVNEKDGFTPVRLLGVYITPKSKKKITSAENESAWVQKNGVWVPKSCRITSRSAGIELAFEWESVNQPVPEVLFTPKGFDAKEGRGTVVDFTLAEPVVVEDLNREDSTPPPATPSRLWQYALGAVAVAVAASAVGVLVWRRRRNPGTKPA